MTVSNVIKQSGSNDYESIPGTLVIEGYFEKQLY